MGHQLRTTALTAKRFLSRRSVALLAVNVLARAGERLLWGVAAVGLIAHDGWPALAASGAIGAWVMRGVARSLSAHEIRERIAMCLAGAPFDSDHDVVGDNSDQREAMIFDSRYAAERALTVDLPTLIAEPLAWSALVLLASAVRPAVSVVALAAAACLALSYWARRFTDRNSERAWKLNVKVSQGILVSFAARSELLANGCESEHLAQVRANVRAWTGQARAEEFRGAIAGRVPGALITGVVVLWTARAGFNLADLPVTAALVAPLASFARAFIDIRQNRPKLEALHIALPVRTTTAPDGRAAVARPCSILFKAVTYAYSGSERSTAPALRDLSFEWHPGTVLLISGRNGSGKTTILKLLAGLAEPISGCIEVGGVDLQSVNIGAWRRDMAYLAQAPYTSDRFSVRQTLALTTPHLSDDDYRRHLSRLAMWPVLEAKNRADPLSVQIRSLSSGERQRVLIARTIARRSSLLLLDEPDESLDEPGKRLLVEIVEELRATAMVAVVSHNESAPEPSHAIRLRI